MKWFKRILFALVVLLSAIVGGFWLFGPPVNIPLRPLLASLLPGWVEPVKTDASLLAQRIELPPGFRLSVFAAQIPDARMLRVTSVGDLLVATPSTGEVHWLRPDASNVTRVGARRVLLSGLDGPNGLEVRDGFLYVAEQHQIIRIAYEERSGEIKGKSEVFVGDLPPGGTHWRKTIRFGPDGDLYLAIGSTCNVCVETDERRAALLRINSETRVARLYATGLRNSAGFDWDSSGRLFATDNGRDLLGDNYPPCELNEVVEGGFYGWPFVNGDGDLDPDLGGTLGQEKLIANARPPAYSFRAHNAPLGILFPRLNRLGEGYQGAALVALHGSWNRSNKDGYKVVSLHFAADGTVAAKDFVSGFLHDDEVIGRPAELAEARDGSIYLSDDFSGQIYRIAYGEGEGVIGGEVAAALPANNTVTNNAMADVARRGNAKDGERLYVQMGCDSCHGADLSSGGQVALMGLKGKYDVASLTTYLKRPKPPMPPVGDGDQRAHLAAYLLVRFGE